VRRDSEWEQSHIDGAVRIALHNLPARIGELAGGGL
jgi:rhodanese-related sulfurtransferase